MKDIKAMLKLAVTLMLVAVSAALILAVVHGATEPIIEDRLAREFQEMVEEFLPGAVSFEEEVLEGILFTRGYNSDGQLKGVIATAKTFAFGGMIEYNLIVSAAGEIVGVRIISHMETPGIGDVIVEPEFQDQLIGRRVEDPVEIGVDVDTVSGATVSTRAMLRSIREVLDIVGDPTW